MPKCFYKGRDPVSSYTHFLGAIFSLIGTFMLVVGWYVKGASSVTALVSVIIFGISMILLYNASSIYHYVKVKPEVLLRLRKLDHAMIYVLIAGTYTPVSLNFMQPTEGIIFTSVIWALAISGILIKVVWFNAPRWLYTSIYLLMGWSIIFDIKGFQAVPFNCLFIIALGGIAYSIGAIIYILKKPNVGKFIGFHEIFHIFIMLGSLLHFIAIYIYVI